jgi:hypothetical protein
MNHSKSLYQNFRLYRHCEVLYAKRLSLSSLEGVEYRTDRIFHSR